MQDRFARTGDEGPVELAKLEALYLALGSEKRSETGRLRRTLGGALVTLTGCLLTVERAPARAARVRTALTTGNYDGRRGVKRG